MNINVHHSPTSGLSNPARDRALRIIAATGLIVGPASLIVTTVIQWAIQPSDPAATIVQVAAQNPAAWLTVSLLAVIGPLVWVAGLPAVAALARERGWLLTLIGGYLTGIGLIAAVGHLAVFFGLVDALATSGVGADAVRMVSGAGDADPVANLLLFVFLGAFSVGVIVLTVGLRRAGVVAVWVPVAAIIMSVANFAGGLPAGIVQLLALLVTFVPIILVVLRPKRQEAQGVRSVPARRESPAI
ncbi:MAG: hypothetical protein ABI255_05220 [Microbacteriaceae bacterium]